MYAEREQEKPKFIPVKLVLESQEEVDKLYAIFNHSRASSILAMSGFYKHLIGFKSNKYEDYWNALDKILTNP